MIVDAQQSPFYAWLDHTAIRELLLGALDVSAGERLVLIKGLIPSIIDDMGEEAFEAFLDELRVKAQRYAEAVANPGEGRANRRHPSEPLGGPIIQGVAHPGGTRNPDRPGARARERQLEALFFDEIEDRMEPSPNTDDAGSIE